MPQYFLSKHIAVFYICSLFLLCSLFADSFIAYCAANFYEDFQYSEVQINKINKYISFG